MEIQPKFKKETTHPRVAVGVLIVDSKEQIFLGRSPKWANRWIVPGGHLEFGEGLEECVEREVKEETNLDITDIQFLRVQEEIRSTEFHDKNRHFIFINYVARLNNTTTDIALNEEFDSYIWINPERALNEVDLNSSTRELIKAFLQKK